MLLSLDPLCQLWLVSLQCSNRCHCGALHVQFASSFVVDGEHALDFPKPLGSKTLNKICNARHLMHNPDSLYSCEKNCLPRRTFPSVRDIKSNRNLLLILASSEFNIVCGKSELDVWVQKLSFKIWAVMAFQVHDQFEVCILILAS